MSIFLLAASYLLGAIPFGLVIGKLAGKDVRTEGSKNIGASGASA
jgi:glycerol-3-phosphate acyltransferase PlsY